MNPLTKIERKLGWLAFPGLFKCIAMLGALVYAISWAKPEFGALIDFDKTKILAGEWWRVATFLFAKGAGRPSVMSLLFLLCAISFAFTISDALEQVWGVTRTTMFLLAGWACLLAGAWFAPIAPAFPSAYFYGATFLAFAWHRADYRLFFPPVPCGVLGIVTLVLLAMTAVTQPWLSPFLLIVHLPVLLWVGPEVWRAFKLRSTTGAKQRDFQAKLRPEREAFHSCTVCQRTEHHAPSLDFRVGHDGREYCDEHLPS